jgi:hypothetical protein
MCGFFPSLMVSFPGCPRNTQQDFVIEEQYTTWRCGVRTVLSDAPARSRPATRRRHTYTLSSTVADRVYAYADVGTVMTWPWGCCNGMHAIFHAMI